MKTGTVTVGHPVDVASGTVYSNHEDISIPGQVDLLWERFYSTALLGGVETPLGPGWTTRYFATLRRQEGTFEFLTPEGDLEVFEDPQAALERGEVVRNLESFQEISKRGQRYLITRWNVENATIERYVFQEGEAGSEWPLRSIEDVTGQGVDLGYDARGRLTSIQQRLEKRTLALSYTASNRIATMALLEADKTQQVLVRYEYDSSNRLIAAHNALGHADRYEYDAENRMTREIFKDGGVFYFKYDDKGRCKKTSGLDRYDEKTFRYLDSIGWTEVTDSLGSVIRYEWLPSGQVVREVDALGGEKTTEYDEFGRIVSKADPNGAATTYEYDERGNRSRIIDPLGHTWTPSYNEHHLPVAMTDPKGGVWRRQYDGANRLVTSVDPLGAFWTARYDRDGNLVELTDPNGSCFTRSYSENGVLEKSFDAEGNATGYRWDSLGRLTERVDPLGQATRFSYNPLGDLTEILLADDSRIAASYDAGGNLTRFTDGNGQTTSYRYGPCRRLLGRTDSLGSVLGYRWGSEPMRLESVINEKGEEYRFSYDPIGRVVQETSFDGRELAFEYDPAGQCVVVKDSAGETVSYARDLAGQVTEQIASEADAAFEYDPFGSLTRAVSPDGEVTFERDPLGRVIRESQGEYSVDSRYDRVGNLIRTTTSLGHEVTYEYDRNGRLAGFVTAGGHTMDFARNAPARRERVVVPLRRPRSQDRQGGPREDDPLRLGRRRRRPHGRRGQSRLDLGFPARHVAAAVQAPGRCDLLAHHGPPRYAQRAHRRERRDRLVGQLQSVGRSGPRPGPKGQEGRLRDPLPGAVV